MKQALITFCFLFALNTTHAQSVASNPVVELNSSGLVDTSHSDGQSTNVVGTGAWSEPLTDAHGKTLRGRLVVYDSYHRTNPDGREAWLTAPIYMEIQDVSATNQNPTRIYFDLYSGVKFEIRDAQGAPVRNSGGGSGGAPRPFWATLPARGLLRLNTNGGRGRNSGRDGDLRLISRVSAHPLSVTIPAGDTNVWFLSATLPPPPEEDARFDSDVWQGPLEFPPVKLTTARH